ncbi:MAG: hypothetical protein ACKOXO_09740 [Cyanobium sp.]
MALLLLVLLLAVLLLPVEPLQALSLPWSRSDPASGAREVPSASALQEVAPPDVVQQLQAALAGHQPVVEIVSPADDTLLPPGPWLLKLRVHDWPLVDGGALGLGPHLVVQLDQEPPRRWTIPEGTLPELAPGSHRLTVYAAQPWGEARRSPGAWQQIRLHRTASNPVALPARGRPQLLPVSPAAQVSAEPLLLDWLLLDAPLQNLRGSGDPWRLRVAINGEEVILDQQTPLWLRGWRPGRNAVRLELLDGRGDPVDPPFNSLVQEVDWSRSLAPPRWLGARLSPAELAVLLGRTPPPLPEPPPAAATITPPPDPAPAIPAAGDPAEGSMAAVDPSLAREPVTVMQEPEDPQSRLSP